MSLVHNEQTKLRATYLNGLAIAVFAVGGLAPAFNALYATAPGRMPDWGVATLSLACLLISTAIHLAAMRVLRELRE